MAIYLDSASITDARRALSLGFVSGVTTNPTFVAKTGRRGREVLAELLALGDGPVFYQVTAPDAQGRLAQARQAVSAAPERVVVKVPATTENIALAAQLTAEGLRVCVTAVNSPAQAYLAAQAGAAFVAPYVNRLTRQMGDGLAVVRQIAALLVDTETRVLAASLKSVDEVVDTLLAGAHDVTMPLDLILALGEHPFSQRAIEQFDAHGDLF